MHSDESSALHAPSAPSSMESNGEVVAYSSGVRLSSVATSGANVSQRPPRLALNAPTTAHGEETSAASDRRSF